MSLLTEAILITAGLILAEYLWHRHREQRRQREREHFRHITGARPWWGAR